MFKIWRIGSYKPYTGSDFQIQTCRTADRIMIIPTADNRIIIIKKILKKNMTHCTGIPYHNYCELKLKKACFIQNFSKLFEARTHRSWVLLCTIY